MFEFGIKRMVTEVVVNLKTGEETKVEVPKVFHIIVDLKKESAYWKGEKKTPFAISNELLAWCKDQA